MFLSFSPVLRGALFSFLGFVVFVCADGLTKLSGLSGPSPAQILCLSGWSASATLLLIAIMKKTLPQLKPNQRKPHIIRAALFLCVGFANMIAFTNLPLPTVYVFLYAGPFCLSLISRFFMGETLSRGQITAILVGFVGVLVAILPELQNKSSGLGNPVLGYAVLPFFLVLFISQTLFLRIMGRTETPESTAFTSFLTRGVVLFPVLWFNSLANVAPSSLFYILAMGVCAGVGTYFVASAYKLAPVAIVSPFQYVQLPIGALLGYLVWGSEPSLWVWIGGAIIVASGLLVAHEARRLERMKDSLLLKEVCETEATL